MTTVVVSGALANKPGNGGAAWTRLSWALGLRRLGCTVYFVEQLPANWRDCAAGLGYFQRVMREFRLADTSALLDGEGRPIYGLGLADLQGIAASADLLVNISGHLDVPALKQRFRRRVYVDLDPGFTQFWNAAGLTWSRLVDHDFYFTVGENVGTPTCSIPTNGIQWRPIRQPVVLADWPVVRVEDSDRFTTVATWRGPYAPIQHAGVTYGLKAHEFRKFLPLPRVALGQFEIALDIHRSDQKDVDALLSHGWHVVDPGRTVPDPPSFRSYVQGSSAEFSAAQGIYVATGSGWFSDRTARYLASGKPVVVQDTGFSRTLPVGEGLISFRDLTEAAAGVERVARDYERHCQAARALAEEYFDSTKVLGQLLDVVGVAP